MYKYTFLLYNAIYKCPKSDIPFTVYRGTISHYLREEPNKYFYLNTFTSTSSDFRTANSLKNGIKHLGLYIILLYDLILLLYILKILKMRY